MFVGRGDTCRRQRRLSWDELIRISNDCVIWCSVEYRHSRTLDQLVLFSNVIGWHHFVLSLLLEYEYFKLVLLRWSMTPKIVVHAATKSSHADEQAQLRYMRYGWGKLRFDGVLSRPVTAYVILCLCTFTQNFSVNGANNAVISTLERVFYLDSVQSGLFLALYDLATVFSSPAVGYLGSRYSSPIFFSLNMIIVGMGNMLIASSNFVHRDTSLNFNSQLVQEINLYNNVIFQCDKDPLNERNITDVACLKREQFSGNIQQAKAMLYLGNFVNGIGSVALFTVGVAYIERIFPKEKAAYCQGIYFAVGSVGGALGIVVTGRFLQLFTKLTPKRRLPSWLTPSHPLWIGCWWLPYFIYGSLCLLIGLFVSGLPNFEEPGKKHPIALVKSSQPHLNPSREKRRSSLLIVNGCCSSVQLDIPIIREDSPTSVTIVVSRPSTPSIERDPFPIDLNSKSEPVLVSLKPINDGYRLSNRRLRQLSPLEPVAKTDSSLAVESPEEGFINHAYSSESLYNQLAMTNSSESPSLTATDSSTPPSSTTTDSSIPKTSRQVMGENFKHMCSVVGELLRNPRYVFIIVASLFEGILIKGKSYLRRYPLRSDRCNRNLCRLCSIHHQILRVSTSAGHIDGHHHYRRHRASGRDYRLSDRCLFDQQILLDAHAMCTRMLYRVYPLVFSVLIPHLNLSWTEISTDTLLKHEYRVLSQCLSSG